MRDKMHKTFGQLGGSLPTRKIASMRVAGKKEQIIGGLLDALEALK